MVLKVRWIPHEVVRGMACDTPVVGYRNETVNLLRLWKAEAAESFDFQAFNTGDYYGAVMEKVKSENITKVLYPNDMTLQGKKLRLQQQYFFVSCALQDIIRIYLQRTSTFDELADKWAVQLNDTHPSIAVAELMRLLIDEHAVEWELAWEITQRSLGYTNHTLLPEALERWPIPLFASLLPRHLEIIYEINRRFLDQVRRDHPADEARVRRLSIIDENGERYVRMANLACVGSHAINGVAALHSDLLKTGLLRDFFEIAPEKFGNKTNGVTPRRFLVLSNPDLTGLITRRIGDGFVRHLDELRRLEPLAEDAGFRAEWRAVKRHNNAAPPAAPYRAPFSVFVCGAAQPAKIKTKRKVHMIVLFILYFTPILDSCPSFLFIQLTVLQVGCHERLKSLGGRNESGFELKQDSLTLLCEWFFSRRALMKSRLSGSKD